MGIVVILGFSFMEVVIEFDFFGYVILPALIFLARIIDVSLGTMRIMFISRGLRYLAPMAGFIESLIWLIAVSQIVQDLSNWITYVAFAGGFATGNLVGMMLESRLALGLVGVRLITQADASELIEHLRAQNFGITSVSATGISGNVRLIFSVIKRSELNTFREIVLTFNPNAFMSIEDVRSVQQGYFGPQSGGLWGKLTTARK